MCGIAGFYGFEDKTLIKKMCNVIKHRGPDDFGHFTDKKICLGNRRLSIIDLKTGRQPIHNEDETAWIVFNGEIYNYKALKQELESKGHRFYTNSDTETIVHAYEEYGDECPKKLRGMFSFAIWDSEKQKLLLARDRLGIKPLYYMKTKDKFLFASEIKSILQYPVKRRVDMKALSNYLTFTYIPAPETMFEGIKKLPPAHILVLNKGKIKISKYWDIDYSPTNFDEKYYVKKLQEVLKESVKLRLMSEVPLGAFLSGGLDSSSVVAIMSSLSDKVKTVSAVFEGDSNYDESKYAKIVAERFQTDHHEVFLEEDYAELLPKIVWHFDEPSADPSSVAEYLISQKAKKHVTVALVGEGGDELFAGYRQYKIMSLAYRYHRILPGYFKNVTIPKISSRLSKKAKRRRVMRTLEFLSGFTPTLGDPKKSYKHITHHFTEEEKRKIMPDSIEEKVIDGYFRKNNFIRNMFLFELKVPLPDILLMNVDKMTMAHSVEARVPFLDHRLVEFSASIPFRFKLKSMKEKYILKKAMKEVLPKEILKRKKHPFAVPLIEWLETGLKDMVDDYLSKKNIEKQGHFKYNHVDKIIKTRDYNRIWPLLFFEIWNKTYIENDKLSINI